MLPIEVEYYILLFFLGAVLGWIMEVVCKLIQFHRFINRGFLIGPYCPIYGFGAVLVTVLLDGFRAYPAAVFVQAMVVCGTLEYFTSWAMEKLFHARWWDYSQKRFNLNGRICADTLIPFGLLGLGMIYGVKPVCFGWFAALSRPVLDGLCIGLVALILTDVVVSSTILGKIRHNATLQKGDSTEAITRSVRQSLERSGLLIRRALHAFPQARLYNAELKRRLEADRKAFRAEMRTKAEAFRLELEESERKLKADLRSKTHR